MRYFPTLMALVALSVSAFADEGMWLFNQFPKDKVQSKYGVTVDQKLLDHLRLSSVRVGASGSFVSSKGLILTNHHVVLGCVQNVSSPEHDYVNNGFYAKSNDEEKKCPGAEANVLLKIEDVTPKVRAAIQAAPDSPEGNRQRKAELVRLENECSKQSGNNCQSVTLYGGAQYNLYQYKKYTDVRLVFAPEFQIGFFGGDPDNFTYPRYCLDVGFFRVYENGQPAETPDYLRWSREGVKDRDVVFVSGNPARTERLLTVAELENFRDVGYPFNLKRLESAIAALKDHMAKSAENERASKDTLFGFENSYKSIKGQESGLMDARLMAEKRDDERKLREAIAKDPAKRAQYGDIFDRIAGAIKIARTTFVRRAMVDGGPMGSTLFRMARNVVRLPEEKAKPEDQRLREYSGSALRSLENRMYAATPVTPAEEVVLLANYFRALIAELGAADPITKSVLAGRTPQAAAEYYVGHSKLADPAERKRLAASVEVSRSSDDSMVALARLLDPEARKLRKDYEDKVESVLNAAKPKLAEARFAVYGPGEPPDATFTLRLSYGQVRGYEDSAGKAIPYATKFDGLYRRATGEMPYVLPKSWIAAKGDLNLNTPFDFVSTADIVGGNSGSPTVNAKGEIVGLIFDGNIESLPNSFVYTETQARAVHVASQAILEALRKVYHAQRLLEEIGVVRAAAAGAE